MLVGVISDTHDNLDLTRSAARLFVEEGVELVLHLGDIIAPFTLRVFSEAGIKRLIAVYGNNCGERLGLKRVADRLGYAIHEPPHVLELDGRRLLMLHGQGSVEETVSFVEALAASGKYHAVLYGHTHRPDNRVVSGTLILNPGEACGYLTGNPTIAILDLKRMEARIVPLSR